MDQDQIRASLLVHALNSLPGVGEGHIPCCATECAPCKAVVLLHEVGILDDWVRPYLQASSDDQDDPGWDWWQGSVASGSVRWDWVTERVCVSPEGCIAQGQCLAHLPDDEVSP